MIVRIFQVINGLLICPMLALGVMASLSGGGVTPAFQIIGGRLMWMSLVVPAVCIALAELIYRRFGWPFALPLLIVPLVVWAWLVIELQLQTGFFS